MHTDSYRWGRAIGPWGTSVRTFAGVMLIALAFVSWGPDPIVRLPFSGVLWWQLVIGVVLLPGALTLALRLRGRTAPPLNRYGLGSVGLVMLVVMVLVLIIPVAGLLAVGASSLTAAIRGDDGCEVLAIPNWLRRRDDRVGCILMTPIDNLEARRYTRRRTGRP